MSRMSEMKNCSQAATGVSNITGVWGNNLQYSVMAKLISVYLFFNVCRIQFFASMLTYPFVLVSNLMTVNNCG